MENKSWYLDKISYYFTQEGNTLGTTSESEEMIVDVETQLGSIEKDGGFLVIRSNSGWSVNDVKELTDMLELVETGVGYKNAVYPKEDLYSPLPCSTEDLWENRDEVPFVVDTPKINNILE